MGAFGRGDRVSYTDWGLLGLAAVTTVFVAGYLLGLITRVVTAVLRLALLAALVGGLCWAGYATLQHRDLASSLPAKAARTALRWTR